MQCGHVFGIVFTDMSWYEGSEYKREMDVHWFFRDNLGLLAIIYKNSKEICLCKE